MSKVSLDGKAYGGAWLGKPPRLSLRDTMYQVLLDQTLECDLCILCSIDLCFKMIYIMPKYPPNSIVPINPIHLSSAAGQAHPS